MFPEFYQEAGPEFILFMEAYYEWMSGQGNPVGEARQLLDLRDIDNTTDALLPHFQRELCYGIPFQVVVAERFLLKHVLDVYRSKGSAKCFRLLLRLMYGEDSSIYIPNRDMLRLSAGTWVQPQYLEVTDSDLSPGYVGQTIVGVQSRATAIVEYFSRETVNRDVSNILYVSHVQPAGGFLPGEQVVPQSQLDVLGALTGAPEVVGSMNAILVASGGQGFAVGDALRVSRVDPVTGYIAPSGIGGEATVTQVSRGYGVLDFKIVTPGWGYSSNSTVLIYRGPGDTTGTGASFKVGAVGNPQVLTYATDLILGYQNLYINAASYGFPGDPSANATSNTIGNMLSWNTQTFGSVASLTNIRSGNQYTETAEVFVGSLTTSGVLPGTVSYSPTSNTVTGIGTTFTQYFSANGWVCLQANGLVSSRETQVVQTVVSDTVMVLWGPPTNVSGALGVADIYAEDGVSPLVMQDGATFLVMETGTPADLYMEDGSTNLVMENGTTPLRMELLTPATSLATCYVQTPIVPAQWAAYEAPMLAGGGGGPYAEVQGKSSFGSNSVVAVSVVDSGRAFLAGQQVTLYLYGAVETPQVVYGGTGYANGEQLLFVGGIAGSARPATGYVTTDAHGTVVDTTLTFNGSGYVEAPRVSVFTANGTGVILATSLSEYDEFSEVTGSVQIGGVGTAPGGWTTTQGFLNADKYIQDSYYYQDFSYELQVARDFSDYAGLLRTTFHPSGSQMFGKYTLTMNESSPVAVASESGADGEVAAQRFKSPPALVFDIVDNSMYFPVVSP